MEYRSGQFLRDAYISRTALLPESLNSSVMGGIYLRSDDQPRTIQSGQALFNGMYPQGSGGHPVEWHTRDAKYRDSLVCQSTEICPNIANATLLLEQSEAYKSHSQRVTEPLKAQLSAITGPAMWELSYGFDVMLDCLYSHLCPTVPSIPTGPSALPAELTPALQQQAVDEAAWQNYIKMNNTRLQKLTTGPLVREILHHADRAFGEDAYRFMLYSAHDTGPVMPLLGALGIGDGMWARFAALIAIEVYDHAATPSTRAVRVIYNGVEQRIPACDGGVDALCDYDVFKKAAMAVVPTEQECGRPLQHL